MVGSDDATRVRAADASLLAAITREIRGSAFAATCLVARTTTIAAYPTTAASFYACNPVTVLGAEVEGGAGTKTVGSSTILALNLGSAIPPAGTEILATFVGCRWVFRYDG